MKLLAIVLCALTLAGCGTLPGRDTDAERMVKTVADACNMGEVAALEAREDQRKFRVICK